jgi:hypothetical protein
MSQLLLLENYYQKVKLLRKKGDPAIVPEGTYQDRLSLPI